MTGLQGTLAQLPYEEPSWIFGARTTPRAEARQAAAFLATLEDEDFGLFVLAYGFGMRLGVVSQTLRIEPALVVWRIQRALRRWGQESGADPAMLETAITALLRGETGDAPALPPPPGGRGSWLARELVPELDQGVQARLQAQLESGRRDTPRPGVGIGSLALIVLAVAAFVIFGAIRDINPLWRGKSLMQRGDYAAARGAFQEALERKIGEEAEAYEQTALCWLAEGEYAAALQAMERPGVLRRFGAFGPRLDVPLEPLDTDPQSGALLPRGFTLKSIPTFIYVAGPPGELTLSVTQDDRTHTRTLAIPDSRDGTPFAHLPYPEDWAPIPPGSVVDWSISRAGVTDQAIFDMAEKDQRQEVTRGFARFLTRDVPNRAREFFRGHYYLNKQLFENAGYEFAKLAQRFPGQDYPVVKLQEVSAALGVDPAVFLR